MKTISVPTRSYFRKWLEKNHDKETKVATILHKKHTGKSAPSHREMIEEAICFGWIDTTVKRLDEDRYIRNFTKRTKNSRWSNNTIKYGKQMIEQKKMTPTGLKFYKEGLKKPTHDQDIPKNPDIPVELKKALAKNKKARDHFEKFPPSTKKMLYRWILRGKREETRTKRIKLIVNNAKEGKKDLLSTQAKVNS
mgnify:CR=1 FL=1|jgi:uncharacterized protein YdeI (YjbR/CyaY-like superfamily)